jgi:uncharacterized membrane protein
MPIPQILESAAGAWSSYYGNHQGVSMTIRYLHLASTVVSGGSAMALDRTVIKALRQHDESRRQVLAQLRDSHRVVVPALVVVVLSGILMTAADLQTFLASQLFWIKMALMVALVVNGALLVAAESSALGSVPPAWRRLSSGAVASVVLWLAIVLAGTWLTVAA